MAGGSGFWFHSLPAISISVEADGFAQGLQSAPRCQNGMGALLLWAVTELIRSILEYLKVFWAPNHWNLGVPVQTRPNLPLAQITSSTLVVLPTLSSRAELCNALIAVGL